VTREQLVECVALGYPTWVVVQHDEDGSLEIHDANVFGGLACVTSERWLDSQWSGIRMRRTARWQDSTFRCNRLPRGVEPLSRCATCEGAS